MSVESRTAALRAKMADGSLDAFIVHHNSDLRWLTGFSGMFDEEEAHFALITAHDAVLHTDSRYLTGFEAHETASPTGWGFTVEPRKVEEFLCERLKAMSTDPSGHARKRTGGDSIGGYGDHLRIGFEDDIAWKTYRSIDRYLSESGIDFDLVETTGTVEKLRAVKDPLEVEALRRAQHITDEAFEHMLAFMQVGMTESQVALELEYTMRRLGASGLAFPSIVAAGENGASPHSIPGQRRLERGDMVVMDFGARVDDYDSDMTRTVCMGPASKRQREVYATVLEAQTTAKAAIRAGVKGSDIHKIAADIIGQAGFGAHFGHALGHGVGIDIHESPTLSPLSDTMLPSGAVVTVEPGIYLPGEFGVRIEDFGVVTEDGFEVFTASPHDLEEIG